MKRLLRLKLLPISMSILIVLFSCTASYAQKFNKALVSFRLKELYATIDNLVFIVAQQSEPVSLEQVEVFFHEYSTQDIPPKRMSVTGGRGYFNIHPDNVGLVEFRIKIGDVIDTIKARVKPIVAVGRLSRHEANSDEPISPNEMKAQGGLGAYVECCGFDANCMVVGYQVIRISSQNISERAINKGARFEDSAKLLIEKAQSGDIYIFRKIRYLCPGDKESKRLDDMIFDIN